MIPAHSTKQLIISSNELILSYNNHESTTIHTSSYKPQNLHNYISVSILKEENKEHGTVLNG